MTSINKNQAEENATQILLRHNNIAHLFDLPTSQRQIMTSKQ